MAMTMAMAEHDVPFGDELRSRRQAAGMSLPTLARLVHYSTGYLSKIENGHKRPTVELARLCDAVLDAGGSLAAMIRPRPRCSDTAEEPTDPDDQVWMLRLAADGSGEFIPVDRRHLPEDGETGLAGLCFLARGAATAAQSDHVLSYFRSQFDEIRRLGHTTSPFVVLPILVVKTRILRAIARGASIELRRSLLCLAARYAEFAGWMAQECGDDRAASWWTATAVRLATAGGDPHLAHYALVRKADLALYRHDATDTIRLTRKAQSDDSAPARVRGIAAQREAQGHALAGDYDSCVRALDRAGALLNAAAREKHQGPVLGSTSMPDPVAIATGWCLQEIGRSADAAEILDEQVATMPRTARRARALWGARRTLAHASAGEVDHACALATGVLDDAEVVDSATVRSELRALARTLARRRTHPPVQKLMPRLTRALHTPPC
jgi:transcriptional regulator with XRE-family HTH domain